MPLKVRQSNLLGEKAPIQGREASSLYQARTRSQYESI
jgi:hypothetical protein